MKNLWAVLAALIAASIVVFAIESIQLTDIQRPSADASMDEVEAYLAELPLVSFIKIIIAHALGALTGGLVARWISKSRSMIAPWIFGCIFLLVTIINLFAIPHPLWFMIVDLVVILPFCYLGALIIGRPKQFTN